MYCFLWYNLYLFIYFCHLSRHWWVRSAHWRSHLLLSLSQQPRQLPLFLPRHWLYPGTQRAQLSGWAVFNTRRDGCSLTVCHYNECFQITFWCFSLSDIDECAAGTHSCGEDQSCFNVQGGFRCLSFECPSNFRRAGDTWVNLNFVSVAQDTTLNLSFVRGISVWFKGIKLIDTQTITEQDPCRYGHRGNSSEYRDN